MQGDFFLTTWFLAAMQWVYSNINDVFLTILICTLVLRLITIFSDIKTRKSSQKMALVQPEINRIQAKYKDDPRRAQMEQKKLMKERGVSMWSSCLPLLITMPLFFCFFAAFRFWSYEQMLKLLVEDNPAELLESFRFLWVNNIWQPDNGLSPVVMEGSQFLITQDLSNLLYLQNNPGVWEKLIDMGIAARSWTSSVTASGVVWTENLQILSTPSAIQNYDAAMQPLLNVYAGRNNGWFILPLLAAGSNLLSTIITQKGQPKQEGPGGKQGKMMMYIFPVMSFVICLSATSAFSIYWTISSVIMIIINLILNKVYPRTPIQEVSKK